MSTLQFKRGLNELSLTLANGDVLGPFDAANNVDSHSKGPWPAGTFDFDHYAPHPGDSADSAYGSHGIFIFSVPEREGMGVHSGRATVPDGLGRTGYRHCTYGCIRTTDDAMAQLLRANAMDAIASISVSD
jgi:hypothetical protein